jgi:nicotinate-nucleotide pyrophosphorylase (carboxylating)
LKPPRAQIDLTLSSALEEDIGAGDLTSLAVVPAKARASARLIARQAGVAAGLEIFARAFKLLDAQVKIRLLKKDGAAFKAGACLVKLDGFARALLAAERVALNFAQRLSGVATLTSQFVAQVKGTRAVILDTRKTTPGLRLFEKYAVTCGGGMNHRMGLYDAFLIKDNHIRMAGSPGEAVRRARKFARGKTIEVEVESLAELEDALNARPDIILLDNLRGAALKKALARCKGKCLTEVSGGVKLKDVARIANLGVDRISVGALTHSAPALDLSLEFL